MEIKENILLTNPAMSESLSSSANMHTLSLHPFLIIHDSDDTYCKSSKTDMSVSSKTP